MKKKIISLALVTLMLITITLTFASCKKDPYEVTHYATIEIEEYGTINLELYGNAAPKTVENFEKL